MQKRADHTWTMIWRGEIDRSEHRFHRKKLATYLGTIVGHHLWSSVVCLRLNWIDNPSDGGWYLICESNVVGDEAEPYSIELANELISATQQMAGVEVIREDV